MRLNQSGRQNIGYVYPNQVNNDIGMVTNTKSLSNIHYGNNKMTGNNVTAVNDLAGSGMSSKIVDGILKSIKFIDSEKGKELKESIKKIDPDRIKTLLSKYTGKVSMASKMASKAQYDVMPNSEQDTLIGSGHDPSGCAVLPGELLKKKIIRKMMKDKKKKQKGGELIAKNYNGQSMSRDLGKGYKLKGGKFKGGFVFTLAAIIAAASAAASSAMAVTVVGSITVGTLVGAVATGMATATGGLIVKAIDQAGKGHRGMKGRGIKDSLVKVIKETKIGIQDLPTKDKIKLKAGYEKLKNNPSKQGVIDLGKTLAPIARDVFKNKLENKINEIGMSGSGLRLSGTGEAKKFDNKFVQNFTKTLLN
jgi:hypothetical protein